MRSFQDDKTGGTNKVKQHFQHVFPKIAPKMTAKP